MAEEIEQRIDNLIEALDALQPQEPPEKLKLLVAMPAMKADEEMMSDMQMRG